MANAKETKTLIENTIKLAEKGLITFWEAERDMRAHLDRLIEEAPYGDFETTYEHLRLSRRVWRWLLDVSK